MKNIYTSVIVLKLYVVKYFKNFKIFLILKYNENINKANILVKTKNLILKTVWKISINLKMILIQFWENLSIIKYFRIRIEKCII